MKNEVVAPQAAEEILGRWQEVLDVELDADTQGVLVKAIRSGRLDFNEDTEEFTIILRKPIELQNGDTIEKLTLSEPSGEQIGAASKSADTFQQTLKIIASLSGQPLGVVNRLKMRDLNLAGSVISFFG